MAEITPDPTSAQPQKQNPIARLLASKSHIVLDGALATELEKRGCDMTGKLWSCQTLLDEPATIQQVHQDYFEAGADIAITSSYQASVQGLREHKGMLDADAMQLMRRSVELAQAARKQVATRDGSRNEADMVVAGSVGPYGAYLADGSEYRGDYGSTVSSDEFKNFHRPRIQALLDAGADMLACESMPSIQEVQTLSKLLQEEFQNAYAWFSFTLKDYEHLSDGSKIAEVCSLLSHNKQVVAIGANCIPRHLALPAIKIFRSCTSLPVVMYPNSGEEWDAEKREWRNQSEAYGNQWSDCVESWRRAGAVLIGGCCRTGPDQVRATGEVLSHNGNAKT